MIVNYDYCIEIQRAGNADERVDNYSFQFTLLYIVHQLTKCWSGFLCTEHTVVFVCIREKL